MKAKKAKKAGYTPMDFLNDYLDAIKRGDLAYVRAYTCVKDLIISNPAYAKIYNERLAEIES